MSFQNNTPVLHTHPEALFIIMRHSKHALKISIRKH